MEEILSAAHPYVDFSSDRSTWFFKVEGVEGTQQNVFCDFFSPFDPFTRVETYDPLVLYSLDGGYAVRDETGNHVVEMPLCDLEQLYDPYFAWHFEADADAQNGTLYIRSTLYEKLEIDGFGARNTKLLYYKHVWDLALTVADGTASEGVCVYSTYAPALGGRNVSDFAIDESSAQTITTNVTLADSPITLRDGVWYAPANVLMSLMGKRCFEAEGYLHIQTEHLVDVTAEMPLSERMEIAQTVGYSYGKGKTDDIIIPEVVVPSAANSWHGGCYEHVPEGYSWADYMNDVLSGARNRGWLWRGTYLSSGDEYLDLNGEIIEVVADRIVPINLYVPSCYDARETRLVYMLHGGTGNENTATYRLMVRDAYVVEVDTLAEAYNYIIVSPNGWTQNPM